MARRHRERFSDSGHLRQQALIGNLQPVVQSLDHPQAEGPLAVQNLGIPPTRTDESLQVTRRQPLLLHAEPDGPVRFHFPAPPIREDLEMAAR